MKRKKHILFCILNWGLGHATRCMPIIKELLEQGCRVSIASDGEALLLLQKEFPALNFHELPAYNISYKHNNMFRSIAPQLPKIASAIYKEKKAVQRIVKTIKVDAIIADNRYGCALKGIPCVFITHQLNIKVPNRLLQYFVNKGNHLLIKKFTTCWVPDYEGDLNLAGTLAHETCLNGIKYLGSLSRLKPENTAIKYDYCIVLSGPEPQRTYLEKILIPQAEKLATNQKIILIQGRTNIDTEEWLAPNFKLKSYMTSEALAKTLNASRLIITRSGYSTIMDLVALQKKAILIPTPGQTEQEYLATRFHEQGIYYSHPQRAFDLEEAILASERFSAWQSKNGNDCLKSIVEEWLKELD